MRQRFLSWTDVEALIEHLLPQFYGAFDCMLMLARGGVIPGGLIAERLALNTLYTTAISFPADSPSIKPIDRTDPGPNQDQEDRSFGLRSMPEYQYFPPENAIRNQRVLVVNHVWNHGRSINAVAGRVRAVGGRPELCVFHHKPSHSIFPHLKPEYYAAITDEYVIYPWEAAHRLEPYRPMSLVK